MTTSRRPPSIRSSLVPLVALTLAVTACPSAERECPPPVEPPPECTEPTPTDPEPEPDDLAFDPEGTTYWDRGIMCSADLDALCLLPAASVLSGLGLEIPPTWREHAEVWKGSGDPALDPALDYDTELAEIRRKEAAHAKIREAIDQLTIRFLDEYLGVKLTPKELAGVGAGGVVGGRVLKKLLEAAAKKGLGKKELDELRELWKDAFAPRDTGLLDPSGRKITRKIGRLKGLGRFLGKFALKYPDLILTAGGAGLGLWQYKSDLDELLALLEMLERSLRYEYLRIHQGRTKSIYDFFPETLAKDLRAKVNAPNCQVQVWTQLSYRDPDSGELKKDAHQWHQTAPSPDGKRWSTKSFDYPDKGCNAEARVEYWLICDPEPPKSQLMAAFDHPIRTTKTCPQHGLIR